MGYAVREALAAFQRTPLLTGLSAGMIAVSLFLLGLFGIIAHNTREAVQRIEMRVEVVAYLRDSAPPAEVQAAQQQILTFPEVRDVRYISREQALMKAQAELPEFRTVFGSLDTNPLPASLEIALKPGQRGSDAVKAVADRVAIYPFVEDVGYGSDWLEDLYRLRRAAAIATLVLGAGFALVGAFIIGAAVRMAIYARRDEIAIMRLVGATNAFVQRPFLLEGLITGTLGAGTALLLTYLAYRLVPTAAPDLLAGLQFIPETWAVAGVAAGCAFGVLASAIAVRRYLRDV